jgi:hypothetical protein
MYSLRPGADIWLDADHFVELLRQSGSASKPGVELLSGL